MRSAFTGWNPYCRNDTKQNDTKQNKNPEFEPRTAPLDVQNDQEMGSINQSAPSTIRTAKIFSI